MQRTIRVQLNPSHAQAESLAETSRLFTSAFNQAVRLGWEAGIANATKLHYLVYYPIRFDHPSLVSDLINTARAKASEVLRSAFELRMKPNAKVRMPHSDACPPRYNVHTYRVDWESCTVRMSTATGRQTIRFTIPDYSAKWAGYPTDTADLLFRHGGWWLHIVVTVPAPEITPTEQVTGVDLGIVRPAVTSNHRFLGKRAWKAIEGKLFHLKRALQKKGTRSAKRHLKRVRFRQARFRRDCDHVLSKQIVGSVEPGSTIVIESLTNIRKRTKVRRKTKTSRRIHGWSFAQLRGFIEYKAEERGCTVVAVDPRHTSQACSRCGHTARNNRRSRGRFVCRKCGFELHADLNASRNIAAKYHASVAIRDAGGLPISQPIVSNRESLTRD
jgi:IS605 OrfB family transposase